MTKRVLISISLVAILIGVSCTREGPIGPPGTAGLGTVEGVITVWEDLELNSKNSTVDPSGVTVQLEGMEYSATTESDGSYKIEGVPAGVYTIVAFKDSASAGEYGTVKQYNFFVGGGTSHFSTDIARKTKPPSNVRVETMTYEGYPGILIMWHPDDPYLTHKYTIWQSPDSTNFAQRKEEVTTRRDTIAFIPSYMLYAGERTYFAVTADNGISYTDKVTGEKISPTESQLSEPSQGIEIPMYPHINYYSVVMGDITVLEDLYSEADPSGIIVVLQTVDLWYAAETDENGFYVIEDVPVGIYTVLVFKEETYGEMMRYNFFVGRGISYFSTRIARIADPPENVQADTAMVGGQLGVRVSWDPTDPDVNNRYVVWYSTHVGFKDPREIASTLGRSVFVPFSELPQDVPYLYFAVAADNGISYFDETTGLEVFPTRSDLSMSEPVEVPPQPSGMETS